MILSFNPAESWETSESAEARSNFVATFDKPPPFDADLADLIERWPDLPEELRAGVVALVRAGAIELP